MNDEQKKDITPEQNPAENAVPEEKPAEDSEKESAVEQAADTEAEKGEESKEAEKKEKRRFGRKPSREEEKIAALEKEKADLNDKFLRICAEYDNFRKRSQKEKDALYGDIKANTVTQFLPVYDNLERALKQNTEDEAYKKGVEMIMTQFCSTLEKLGVAEIECLGEKFDPTMHNAVMHVDDEEKGENDIVEVFQKGFKLGEKVIRFAMVKVAN
jgi:molecular chaperone GrpE